MADENGTGVAEQTKAPENLHIVQPPTPQTRAERRAQRKAEREAAIAAKVAQVNQPVAAAPKLHSPEWFAAVIANNQQAAAAKKGEIQELRDALQVRENELQQMLGGILILQQQEQMVKQQGG